MSIGLVGLLDAMGEWLLAAALIWAAFKVTKALKDVAYSIRWNKR